MRIVNPCYTTKNCYVMKKSRTNFIAKTRAIQRFCLSVLLPLFVGFMVVACSDDDNSGNNDDDPSTSPAAVSLTYHNFVDANDVIILDADTTQISVSKALADKLGVDSFEGRPMAIWQKVSCLPFIRRVVTERLEADRYILTVDNSASLADVIPEDTEAYLDTRIFVNHDAANAKARAFAGSENLVDDVSVRYMDGDTIHPAVILYTDPRGYDSDAFMLDDDETDTQNSLLQSQIPPMDEYEYSTAESLDSADADWGIINTNTNLNANIKLDSKADVSVGIKIPIEARANVKIVIKRKKVVKLKEFDMGVYGGFAFRPEVNIGFAKAYSIPKDKGTKRLADFPAYTAVFMVGVVPVWVKFNTGIIFRIDGTLTGSVNTGFTYRYENDFKAGVKYDGKWSAYGEYNSKENKFAMNAINANAQLNTGVGVYLSVDAMLYGFAGPEIAVGPRLGLTANANVNIPTSGTPTSHFDAKLAFGLKALIGAKLKVWKWTLADWNTTFAISPEWEIWKYSTTK